MASEDESSPASPARLAVLEALLLETYRAQGSDAALPLLDELTELYAALAPDDPHRYGLLLNAFLDELYLLMLQDPALQTGAELTARRMIVEVYRALFETNHFIWAAEFAYRLVKLGQALHEANKAEEAMAALEEAIDLRRLLVATDPEAFSSDLASSLCSLGDYRLCRLEYEAAAESLEEAYAIYAALDPHSLNHAAVKDYAYTCTSLSDALGELGRNERAIALRQQGVAQLRTLAESDPAQELLLAAHLLRLGQMLYQAEDLAGATTVLAESAQIYRKADDKDESNDDSVLLYSSLVTLSFVQMDSKKYEDAVASFLEAANIYRNANIENLPSRLEVHAGVLENLGRCLMELGRDEDVVAYFQEETTIWRSIATDGSVVLREGLARSLCALGVALVNIGNDEAAVAAAREEIDVRRGLLEHDPPAYLPDLASSLNQLGIYLYRLHGSCEAVGMALGEAISLYRVLFKENPTQYRFDLANVLKGFAMYQKSIDQWEDAASSIDEAIENYRELNPSWSGRFAHALLISSQIQVEIGAIDVAHARAREALDLLWPAYETSGEEDTLVANVLEQLTKCHEALGIAPDELLAERLEHHYSRVSTTLEA